MPKPKLSDILKKVKEQRENPTEESVVDSLESARIMGHKIDKDKIREILGEIPNLEAEIETQLEMQNDIMDNLPKRIRKEIDDIGHNSAHDLLTTIVKGVVESDGPVEDSLKDLHDILVEEVTKLVAGVFVLSAAMERAGINSGKSKTFSQQDNAVPGKEGKSG